MINSFATENFNILKAYVLSFANVVHIFFHVCACMLCAHYVWVNVQVCVEARRQDEVSSFTNF